MTADELFWRRAMVFGSAIIYWGGVLIQAHRVRRQIGRSPNLKPRGAKERLLWAGWILVIAGWMTQPWLIHGVNSSAGMKFFLFFPNGSGVLAGLALLVAGYAGTLWCYAAMGSAWRIGVNHQEKNPLITRGPYGFIRHPIYSFQIVLLAGCLCLIPTLVSLLILAVHFCCVMIKASDEESYLLTVHGKDYHDYITRTGGIFPRHLISAARS